MSLDLGRLELGLRFLDAGVHCSADNQVSSVPYVLRHRDFAFNTSLRTHTSFYCILFSSCFHLRSFCPFEQFVFCVVNKFLNMNVVCRRLGISSGNIHIIKCISRNVFSTRVDFSVVTVTIILPDLEITNNNKRHNNNIKYFVHKPCKRGKRSVTSGSTLNL